MVLGIGERLRKLRTDNRFSQRDVARLLNISTSLVSAYETGERIPPSDKLVGLADLFHTTTDYILGRNVAQGSCISINTENMTSDQIHSLIVMAESISSQNTPRKS